MKNFYNLNSMTQGYQKNLQYYKFCLYGFLKNLRFFEPFLLLFFLSRDLEYWQIGLLYTVREITRNLLEIPMGIISDSLGRRTTLALSFVLYIASYLTFYFSESYVIIMVAMLLFGLGDALKSGTNKAMIYSYLEYRGWSRYKAAYYGNTRSCSQIGSAICSVGGAAFIWYSGAYASIFLFSLFPAFLDLLLILSYPRNLEGNNLSAKQESAKDAFRDTFLLLWKQMGKLKFWHNTNLVALHTGFYKTVRDYLQPILASLAVSVPLLSGESEIRREVFWIGLFYFVIYLLSSLAASNSGRFANKIKNPVSALRRTTYMGLVFGIIGGFLAWQNLTIISIIILIGIFMVENIRKPIGAGNLADSTHSESWTSVLSLESQTASLYAALMAPLLGLFADFQGPGFGLAALAGVTLVFNLLTEGLHKYFNVKKNDK